MCALPSRLFASLCACICAALLVLGLVIAVERRLSCACLGVFAWVVLSGAYVDGGRVSCSKRVGAFASVNVWCLIVFAGADHERRQSLFFPAMLACRKQHGIPWQRILAGRLCEMQTVLERERARERSCATPSIRMLPVIVELRLCDSFDSVRPSIASSKRKGHISDPRGTDRHVD